MTALLLALLLAADTSPKYVVIEPHRGVANAVPLSTTPGVCGDATHALAFNGTTLTCQAITGSSGAPTTATFITQTHDATLSAEQAMADLGTGLVKNTTTTGVQSIYAGSACAANTVARSTDSSGVLTCSAVALGSADVSGTLTEARGGTGAGALTCSAGQALTSNGTIYSCTSTITASDVVCSGTCIADAEIASVAGSKVSGAVATATALASDPSDCTGGQYATAIATSGNLTCAQVAYSQISGTPTIPTDISAASYWTKVAEASLSNEVALGSLASGLILNTTTTGVPTIYAGSACGSNTVARSTSASGALTCSAVALGSADVSGTLTVGKGGTGNTVATDDSVMIGNSTDLILTALPSCSSATCALQYNTSTNAFGTVSVNNTVEKSIVLSGGSGFFSATVTGQTWVTASSVIVCAPFGTTADGLTPEAIAIGGLTAVVSDRVVGTGFNINVFSPYGLEGTVRLHCTGA